MKRFLRKFALKLIWRRIRRTVAIWALVILILTSLHFGHWHRMGQ